MFMFDCGKRTVLEGTTSLLPARVLGRPEPPPLSVPLSIFEACLQGLLTYKIMPFWSLAIVTEPKGLRCEHPWEVTCPHASLGKPREAPGPWHFDHSTSVCACVLPGMEPRVSCMLGKHFPLTDSPSPPVDSFLLREKLLRSGLSEKVGQSLGQGHQ